jgi:xanthine dehydrogenase accessory factor
LDLFPSLPGIGGMTSVEKLLSQLATESGVLVSVHSTRGSVPREKGTWMAVFTQNFVGTVGGGHLEFEALASARHRLQGLGGNEFQIFPLGPALGQCCGGEVTLRFELVDADDAASLARRLAPHQFPLALFGGGHVGHALVQVVANLPLAVTWIDSRDEVFPQDVPSNVACEHSDPVHRAVADLVPGSRVLIMSFSHAEDLEVLAACLTRQRDRADLPYVGLIGSKTKWATFQHRLEARGFTAQDMAHVTCPIGVPGIVGKEPEVIAVAVAAQILQTLTSHSAKTND